MSRVYIVLEVETNEANERLATIDYAEGPGMLNPCVSEDRAESLNYGPDETNVILSAVVVDPESSDSKDHMTRVAQAFINAGRPIPPHVLAGMK